MSYTCNYKIKHQKLVVKGVGCRRQIHPDLLKINHLRIISLWKHSLLCLNANWVFVARLQDMKTNCFSHNE